MKIFLTLKLWPKSEFYKKNFKSGRTFWEIFFQSGRKFREYFQIRSKIFKSGRKFSIQVDNLDDTYLKIFKSGRNVWEKIWEYFLIRPTVLGLKTLIDLDCTVLNGKDFFKILWLIPISRCYLYFCRYLFIYADFPIFAFFYSFSLFGS